MLRNGLPVEADQSRITGPCASSGYCNAYPQIAAMLFLLCAVSRSKLLCFYLCLLSSISIYHLFTFHTWDCPFVHFCVWQLCMLADDRVHFMPQVAVSNVIGHAKQLESVRVTWLNTTG